MYVFGIIGEEFLVVEFVGCVDLGLELVFCGDFVVDEWSVECCCDVVCDVGVFEVVGDC